MGWGWHGRNNAVLGYSRVQCGVRVVMVAALLSGIAPPSKGIPHVVESGLPRDIIRQLYGQLLGRPVDDEGLAHYRHVSQHKGVGVAQIAAELLQSEEFRNKHLVEGPVEFAQAQVWLDKMENFPVAAEDVDYLYQKLLGRGPDPAAVEAFTKIFEDPSESLSIAGLTQDVMCSDEFAIVYLYWKLLGREPDAEGRRHFAEIANGRTAGDGQLWPLTSGQIADELLRSDEFSERLGLDERDPHRGGKAKLDQSRLEHFCQVALLFPASTADVTFMYIKILGRWPDDEALSHYGRVIQNGDGISIVQVAFELLQSEEYHAQRPNSLPKTDFMASIVTESAAHKSDYSAQCAPPETLPRADIVQVSTFFLIGNHPSVAGNEFPTMVDQAATRAKMLSHQDSR